MQNYPCDIIEMNTKVVLVEDQAGILGQPRVQNDLLTGIRLMEAPPRLNNEEEIESERLRHESLKTEPTQVIAFILVKSDVGIPRQPPPPEEQEDDDDDDDVDDDDDDVDDDGRPLSQQKTRRIEPPRHFPFVVEYWDSNTNQMLGDGSPKLRLKVPSLTKNNLWYIKQHVNDYTQWNVQVMEIRSFSNHRLISKMNFEFYDLHPDNTEIWLLPVGFGPPSKEDTYALAHRVLVGLFPFPSLPQIDTVATKAALASVAATALARAKEAEEEALSAASSEQLSFGRRSSSKSYL